MAGLPTVQASSQGWASIGTAWSSALNSGWIPDQSIGSTGGFTSRCSPSSSGFGFYSTGDATAFYSTGRRLVIDDGTLHYCEVLSSSSAAVAGSTTSTIVSITNVTSGTTTLSTGTLNSVFAAPFTYGPTGNFGLRFTTYAIGATTAPAVDWNNGYNQTLTASTNLIFSFSHLPTNEWLSLTIQNTSAAFTYAWSTTAVRWASSSSGPTASTALDIVTFWSNGSTMFGTPQTGFGPF